MKSEKITNYFKLNPIQAITVFVSLVTLAITLGNIFIASKLSPVSQNVTDLIQRINADTQSNATQHANFVTKGEFIMLNQKVDRIDSNTQQLYNHFLK